LAVLVLPIWDLSCWVGSLSRVVAKSVMRWLKVCVFSLNCHVNCCLIFRLPLGLGFRFGWLGGFGRGKGGGSEGERCGKQGGG